ncbi:polysaccharide deacetylase [Aequorivita soesokkakensis]|jgi:peptidoglycan/xylan/chitin deacetylase (PgdA/CDA1 family)|uniref:Polysaccharide deacetylase n=1 Tax=Aequorivita soesokkakensis TaxID=1385699 RepID=A0A1A9LGC1_9FLAO|nr:polysaccharide deacetylase family protein [Aequorivita soesokkakensis]OAD91954.1 polysaccharide deacetylase [Aequorivita soesokkakensis]
MAKLPILMYHHVTAEKGKGLTISVEKLEKQFKHLAENGYKTYHFGELAKQKSLPKTKNIIITFDDGYVSQRELALPLLKKYKLKATFFVPLNFLGKTDSWNTSSLEIMTSEQLKTLDPKIVELGFHSFYHKKYTELSNTEIEEDTHLCKEFVTENKLDFSPVLAYPYGKFPKEKMLNESFKKTLSENGINFGLRIGNRINHFPFKKPFEIQRIDVKGEFSMLKFRQKIRFGKLF